MMRKLLLFVACFFAAISSRGGNSDSIAIPAAISGEQIIRHSAYTLSYNEKYELANWVEYELTNEETNSTFDRTNKFLVDPLVITGSADNDDYASSGYDRGHLAPAGDMGFSELAMKESFYYSNMSPQVPSFNRGIWKKLEEQVRNWARLYESIYVVTGPVLRGTKYIGHDSVLVPDYFYKIVLDLHSSVPKAIAFIIPNEYSAQWPEHFVVSVDSVESITGIDFFPALDDVREQKLESNSDVSVWNWTVTAELSSGTSNSSSTSTTQPLTKAVQCSAMTKKGTRCKNMTTNANGRCNVHQ